MLTLCTLLLWNRTFTNMSSRTSSSYWWILIAKIENRETIPTLVYSTLPQNSLAAKQWASQKHYSTTPKFPHTYSSGGDFCLHRFDVKKKYLLKPRLPLKGQTQSGAITQFLHLLNMDRFSAYKSFHVSELYPLSVFLVLPPSLSPATLLFSSY